MATHATADSRSDRGPSARVPADPLRAVRGERHEHLVGGTRRARRGQRGQGPQGPQLPRHLRHPRRRLRGRVPHLPDPARARPRPTTGRSSSSVPATSVRRSPATAGSATGASRSPASSTSTTPRSARSIGGVRVRHLDELAADRPGAQHLDRRRRHPGARRAGGRRRCSSRPASRASSTSPRVCSACRTASACARSTSPSSCRSSATTSSGGQRRRRRPDCVRCPASHGAGRRRRLGSNVDRRHRCQPPHGSAGPAGAASRSPPTTSPRPWPGWPSATTSARR